MNRNISKSLKNIDNKLKIIYGKLSFFAINPINTAKEKEKFFKSKDYEPQFEYSNYRQNLELMKKRLKNMKPGKTIMGKILGNKRDDLFLMANLLQNRGKEDFTYYSIKLYDKPDKKLVKEARKLMKLKKKKQKATISSKELVRKMRRVFLQYGVHWKVREKDMVAKAAVMGSERELRIKKNEKFSDEIVKRLIVHEVGTHIMRIENGSEQPYKLFEYGFPGYLETEEGLAVVNEELNGCLNPRVLRIYAGRVLAIDKSLKYGFRETYNYLTKYFDKQLAWKLTLRAKRGLIDTSQPGACTKDLVYLKGYVDVKNYVQKGGKLENLYYGKIGIQHIELMDKIPGLVHPYYLPMFRYFNFIMSYFSKAFTGLMVIGLTPLLFPVSKLLNPKRVKFKPLKKLLKMNTWLVK